MLNYESPTPQFYTAPVYGAGWPSSAPLLPTTSTDYVPQLVATNSYYNSYNASSTFSAYPPPIDMQQFASGGRLILWAD